MIAPPERRAQLVRMEAAHREARRHLDLIHRQIAARAERMTVMEKAKARSHKRSGSRWTRSDEMLFQAHVERLTFERRNEIDTLSRKLARQDLAIAALRERQGLSSMSHGHSCGEVRRHTG